jgi:hypothetical protein
MMTMATPGQPSVCFSCGQPLPPRITGAAVPAPHVPFDREMARPLEPPPIRTAPPARPTRAPSSALVGQFPIVPGAEVRVGRDPAQCAVALSEPRISGVHSTLKFEAAHLWVRDEQSNNGTYVAASAFRRRVDRRPLGAPAPLRPRRVRRSLES